ncbi:MAG: hypothetical protein ACKVW3_01510 [Phycisphaerales bacterium]
MGISRMIVGVAVVLALAGGASAQAWQSDGGERHVVVRKAQPKKAEKKGEKNVERRMRVAVRAGEPQVFVMGDDEDGPGEKKQIVVRRLRGGEEECATGAACCDEGCGDCKEDDCEDDDGEEGAKKTMRWHVAPHGMMGGGDHEVQFFSLGGDGGKGMKAFGGGTSHDGKTITMFGHGDGSGKQVIRLRGMGGAFGMAGGQGDGTVERKIERRIEVRGGDECCEACGRPFGDGAGRSGAGEWRTGPGDARVFQFRKGGGPGAEPKARKPRGAQGGSFEWRAAPDMDALHGHLMNMGGGHEVQGFALRLDEDGRPDMSRLHEHLSKIGGGHGDAEVSGKIIIIGPDGKKTEHNIGGPKRGPRGDATGAMEGVRIEPVIEKRIVNKGCGAL